MARAGRRRDDEISVSELLRETGATPRSLGEKPPDVRTREDDTGEGYRERLEQRAREAAAGQQRAGRRIRWISALGGAVVVLGSLVLIAVTSEGSPERREATAPGLLAPATTTPRTTTAASPARAESHADPARCCGRPRRWPQPKSEPPPRRDVRRALFREGPVERRFHRGSHHHQQGQRHAVAVDARLDVHRRSARHPRLGRQVQPARRPGHGDRRVVATRPSRRARASPPGSTAPSTAATRRPGRSPSTAPAATRPDDLHVGRLQQAVELDPGAGAPRVGHQAFGADDVEQAARQRQHQVPAPAALADVPERQVTPVAVGVEPRPAPGPELVRRLPELR